ncbi:hypothetical protein V4D05_19105 [Vibrio mimicus]|uniref:hypothetical protein n=1 Tax=Vibrio mimicus TaxID=674 RepID=UPI0029337700|nr:hypothetical protein [Vibrio vulnificus]
MKRSQEKALLWAFFFILLWMYVVWFGMRIPYQHTSFSSSIRWLVVFPLLLSLSNYLLFFKCYGTDRKSPFFMRFEKDKKDKKKIEAVKAFLLLSFFSAFLSYTSISYSAWLAILLPSDSYENTYKVESFDYKGNRGILIEVAQKGGSRSSFLMKTWKFEQSGIKKGDHIRVGGGENFFGKSVTYVYKIK